MISPYTTLQMPKEISVHTWLIQLVLLLKSHYSYTLWALIPQNTALNKDSQVYLVIYLVIPLLPGKMPRINVYCIQSNQVFSFLDPTVTQPPLQPLRSPRELYAKESKVMTSEHCVSSLLISYSDLITLGPKSFLCPSLTIPMPRLCPESYNRRKRKEPNKGHMPAQVTDARERQTAIKVCPTPGRHGPRDSCRRPWAPEQRRSAHYSKHLEKQKKAKPTPIHLGIQPK